MIVFGNNVADRSALSNFVAGFLAGSLLQLFKNNVVVSRSTLIADMTPADYTGYVTESLTFAAPSISDNGVPEVVATAAEFRPTGTTIGNTIYGGFVQGAPGGGGAPGPLLRCFNFDTPIGMNAATDAILLTVRFRLQPDGSLVVLVS